MKRFTSVCGSYVALQAATTQLGAPTNAVSSPSPAFRSAPASTSSAPMAPPSVMTAMRFVNVNPSTQARINSEYNQNMQQKTDYDFDREKWSKQMKFASMDCILDPDLTPANFTSFKGIKKNWKKFIQLKQVKERVPEYDQDLLKKRFIEYKKLCHTKNPDEIKLLSRITTHGEAARITKEINRNLNLDFTKSSWKAIKSSNFKSDYEIEVETLDIVTTYLVNMQQDDWFQVTCKVTWKEKTKPDAEWETITEFPVFEIRLGDTVNGGTNGQFVIVGVLRKDGTRYGRDAQDAAQLRKNFEKSQGGWFG